ncbi:MAG: DNA topoisomerase IV subunit B [bacterium]
MAEKKKGYSDNSIQILEGLEAVRKRPGMYIGSTDSRGLHHLVWEIVDNSIDEALGGHGKEITVQINTDNSITVIDNGRGMPCGMHPSGKNTLEVILTVLHAGGKFGGEEGGYKVSGGLHGVGSSVVNALSTWLEVESSRDGKIHKMRFENGGNAVGKMEVIGETRKTGTKITFKPDPKIFSTTLYSFDTIKNRIRESSFLIKGLRMNLIDKRDKKEESFYHEEGIKQYVTLLNEKKKPLHETCYVEGASNKIEAEVAMQFTTSQSDNTVSFVNNVRTTDGGTHETGFRIGLTKSVNEYARKYKLLKDKEPNLEGGDIREGLTAVISVRIPEALLQFEGQTKAKLGTPAARQSVETVTYDTFTFYLEENKSLADTIVKNAQRNFRAREAARKARDEARNGKKIDKKEMNISQKLAPARSKDPKVTELFLVEGDSAGGSAKRGRNSETQAILALRGKVLNTEKAKETEILKNQEIATMIHAIGADFGSRFDLKKCNYNKIIIMTDADTDGAHIQVLLITFFFSYMRPLIEAGKLYIALPPLYQVTYGGKKKDTLYAYTEQDLQDIVAKGGNYEIGRFKGLGEMDYDQLKETTMDPAKRTLIRVSIDDLSDAENRVNVLMGDDVAPRREWIENHVEFTLEDDYVSNKAGE